MDSMPLEIRRGLLELVAAGDFDNLDIGDDKRTALSYVLQAMALELMATSIKLEHETAPALAVAGAALGGLLGIGNESDDELMVKMHAHTSSIREHITHTIGFRCSSHCNHAMKDLPA